jgi:TRAP-type C4-dicarboxylate transport system substrate-binding protein
MKKVLFPLLVSALMASVASAQTAVKITLATGDAIGSLRNQMGEHLKAEVEKNKGINITVNHIQGPVLGSAAQIMDQVVEGSVQLFGNDFAWGVPYDPDFQPLSFGFTFRDTDHMMKYFGSPVFKATVEKVAANSGLRMLSPAPLASRMFFSVKPLNTVADFKGLKVRAPGLEMFVESYKAYGASPTTVAWNEIYLGLKTKLVEAAHGPVTDVVANKWHLAAPYITKTNDMFAANAWYINEAFWKKLDNSQRNGLQKAIDTTNQWGIAQAASKEKEIIALMVSEGATYSDSFKDREVLRSQAIEALKKFEKAGKWSRGLVASIDATK